MKPKSRNQPFREGPHEGWLLDIATRNLHSWDDCTKCQAGTKRCCILGRQGCFETVCEAGGGFPGYQGFMHSIGKGWG